MEMVDAKTQENDSVVSFPEIHRPRGSSVAGYQPIRRQMSAHNKIKSKENSDISKKRR